MTVERSDAALSVSVVDDGVGTAGAVGVGVASMRERAGELGGSLSISRGTAGGTVVRAVLPLAAAEAVHG